MSRIIAVASQKGGVGKTTTSVNLSASLATLGKRVLIIDLDPQGCAGIACLANQDNRQRGIYELFVKKLPISDLIKPSVLEGLAIVPANIWSNRAEEELILATDNRSLLSTALSEVEDLFDYIIMDCPPTVSHITVAALTAAQSVIIPVQSEYYSFNAFEGFLKLIRTIKLGLNPGLDIEGFLLTMYNPQTRLSKRIESDLKEAFPFLIFDTIIPRSTALAEAPAHNVPAIIFDAKSPGTRAYIRLANELIRKHTPSAFGEEPIQTQSETAV